MAEPRYVLDHTGIEGSDLATSRAFYERVLEPLGFSVVMDFAEMAQSIGFGVPGKPSFWIYARTGRASGPIHVAFNATDRERVHRFHEAALAAGAEDNGPPGLREHYHPTYYGAFVLDPDGNNIEAVCHTLPDD
jgi:catechol 2,3-dioxygenase-like lactoylglutathione lyase family enzyme